jgi:outer membrane biosynthesis protein TonB
MEKKTAILIAAALFPHYPSIAEFHITSDEQPFFNAVDASNHAKGLELKDVTVVTREDLKESKLKKVVDTPPVPPVIDTHTPPPPVVDTPPAAPVVDTQTPPPPVVDTPPAATVKKDAKPKKK